MFDLHATPAINEYSKNTKDNIADSKNTKDNITDSKNTKDNIADSNF